MRVWNASEVVDGHVLLRRLGGGSRADVWLARGAQGPVALKLARESWDRPRLRKEALLLRQLARPGLVPVLAMEPAGHWFTMPVLPGPTVVEWAASASHGERLAALGRLASTLAGLHGAQVFHGDLKPCNVLMSESAGPVLLDLGLAAEPPAHARAGFHGTLGWASPEQLAGAMPDAASDVYGLGRLAWLVLGCGDPMVDAGALSASVQLGRIVPPDPRGATSALWPEQARTLLDMVAVDPGERPGLAQVQAVLQAPACPLPAPGQRELREGLRQALSVVLGGRSQTVVVDGAHAAAGLDQICTELRDAVQRSGRRAAVVRGAAAPREPGLPVLRVLVEQARPSVPGERALGAVPAAADRRLRADTGGGEHAVLQALRAQPRRSVAELAAVTGLEELDLADLLDGLLERGWIAVEGDGVVLQPRASR